MTKQPFRELAPAWQQLRDVVAVFNAIASRQLFHLPSLRDWGMSPIQRKHATALAAQRSSVANVSQSRMSLACMPVLNQRTRCSDVPWVKLSGTT